MWSGKNRGFAVSIYPLECPGSEKQKLLFMRTITYFWTDRISREILLFQLVIKVALNAVLFLICRKLKEYIEFLLSRIWNPETKASLEMKLLLDKSGMKVEMKGDLCKIIEGRFPPSELPEPAKRSVYTEIREDDNPKGCITELIRSFTQLWSSKVSSPW